MRNIYETNPIVNTFLKKSFKNPATAFCERPQSK